MKWSQISEPAISRAAALGFTIPAFHGTHATFDVFDPRLTGDIGLHFGSAQQADTALRPIGGPHKEGANIIPVLLRLRKVLRVKDLFSTLRTTYLNRAKVWTLLTPGFRVTDTERAAIYDAAKMADRARRKAGGEWGALDRSKAQAQISFKDAARHFWQVIEACCIRQGYDGLVYGNRVEGKGDSYVVFDPKNVRVRHARFDPEKTDSDKLLDHAQITTEASANHTEMKWSQIIGEDAHAELHGDRLTRARSLGFDTNKVWYHATTYEFARFVAGQWRGATYFAPTPEGAIRGAGAGGMEHPALSGPTVAGAKRGGLRVIPCFIRGKVWGRDPLPEAWFPDTILYGHWRAILDGAEPIEVPGLSAKANTFLNHQRIAIFRRIYTEGVPETEYDKYAGDNEGNLPLVSDAPPIAEPIFSYTYVEGVENYIREALIAIGFENWLVNDEGGESLAVSNPANIRVKHARFDPNKRYDHGMIESRHDQAETRRRASDPRSSTPATARRVLRLS